MSYVDTMRRLFWTKVVSLDFFCWTRDELLKKPHHRWARRLLFPAHMRPHYDFFNFLMDAEKAAFIKGLRATWRATSEQFKDRYPETNVIHGDQDDGRWIREYAAAFLGEPGIVDYPWGVVTKDAGD